MKHASITVFSKQDYGTHSDENSFDCPGTVYFRGDVISLKYREDMGGGADVTTIATVNESENSVIIHRQGNPLADMVFVPGKDHRLVYNTPMGALHLSIHTEVLSISIDEDKISFEIKYALSEDDRAISDNIIKFTAILLAE